VFIFTHSGSTWSQQAYVKAGTTTPNLLFGYSVGLNGNGNTLGVGAYNDSGRKGAVYVFTRNNGTWSQQTRLLAANGETGDYMGCSMAISDDGNTIVSGTVEDKYSQINAGAGRDLLDSVGGAYVFVRAADKWSQQAYLKAFNPRENDQFGWAVAISRDGNTIAVGSHLEDSGAKSLNGDQSDASMEDSGAVYVYTRTGTTWNPTAYVKASNTKSAAEFGISVALNGDGKLLAVGAPKENSAAKGVNGNQDDKSALNAGAAYVYY
jgi:hypothetical protein